LRFFRFHAAYGAGGHPYAEGIAACIAGRDGLDQLSRERVRMEVMKLVVAPHAVPTLISMADAGLLRRVLGGVSYLSSFENLAKSEAAIGLAPDPVRRLGALGVFVAEDAERRDFTINALSAARDGTVFDYVGGLDDLAERRVRFIGDPKQRIEEDYLRILRFFRFHAAYGASGHPYAEGIAACIAGRDGLDQLSRERVRMEVMKLVVAPHAVPTLISMADAGLLLRVLGGVSYLSSFENLAKSEAAIGLPPDPVRRLGALGVFVAEDAERLWQKLRLTNSEHERLASLAEGWRRISLSIGEQGARALIYQLGPEHFTDHALLGWARSQGSANDAAWHALATLSLRWSAPVFPLKAADFMQRGVAKGPAMGAALAAAEKAWIAAGFPMDAATLEMIAAEAAKSPAA
jgi:poly(A) polymerase